MSTQSVYRASPLKRVRRTKSELDVLDNQIIEVLSQDHPQSVRHVFYRMTDPRLAASVEKSDRGYRHIQDRCVKLRRSGRIPYGWFADLSRRGYFTHTYSSAADFITKMQSLYRADIWTQSDFWCEVWCESRSIASVLLDLCNELAVDLYPCGGFSSLSFVHDAASSYAWREERKPLIVYYIGDYDPAGVMIDVSLERELREHLPEGMALHFERIGINASQIEQYNLPTKPRKKLDKRSPELTFTVEAEAMPAQILRDILRDKVESLLPQQALHAARVAEESERDHLSLVVSAMRGGFV